MRRRQRGAKKGEALEVCQGKNMAPLDVKFPLDTQFTFGSLTFIMGEDGDQRYLIRGI
jgi:hypothetical protein